jgi:signal transduction histidine kinase
LVPRLQDGKLAAILYLHRPVPYRWRDGDIAIAEDVAHRTGDALTRAFAERELIEANHRKDEFLAMLGHELRNPLAPICSAAQMLKIVTPGDGRFQQAVDVINRQSKHLTALVDDLLDVSRVTKGLVDLNKSEVDIRAVIDSAVEQTRPLFEARRHALTVEHGPPSHTVIGDRTRLVQAISNLLNNAGKYTPPAGAISLSVAVSARRVTVEVRDNGVGIDSDLLPRVFDLFTQAQRTPDRAQGGLGIGLALVKTIVTLHGGEISAYSAGRGAGSKFIMSLPLAGQVRDQNG